MAIQNVNKHLLWFARRKDIVLNNLFLNTSLSIRSYDLDLAMVKGAWWQFGSNFMFLYTYSNCLQCYSVFKNLSVSRRVIGNMILLISVHYIGNKITFYDGVFHQLQYVIHFKTKLVISFQHFKKCNRKPDISFVYKKKNCNLCIWLLTCRLTLKFWLIYKMFYDGVVDIIHRKAVALFL